MFSADGIVVINKLNPEAGIFVVKFDGRIYTFSNTDNLAELIKDTTPSVVALGLDEVLADVNKQIKKIKKEDNGIFRK